MRLRIAHLYPDLMNLYGDRGNVIALRQRCRWRGIEVQVMPVTAGEEIAFSASDIIFMGGGQDSEQRLVAADLRGAKGRALLRAVENGVSLLAICGSYQLLGRSYTTASGEELPGIGVFDALTVPGVRRMIGHVIVECSLAGKPERLVGFENHGGCTWLDDGTEPLGRVVAGFGNNGEDGAEGARRLNAFGTYLHGSLLPTNPFLADILIASALQRRYGPVQLPPLDDKEERAAHDAAVAIAGRKPQPGWRRYFHI